MSGNFVITLLGYPNTLSVTEASNEDGLVQNMAKVKG